jgi:hypothetical protein
MWLAAFGMCIGAGDRPRYTARSTTTPEPLDNSPARLKTPQIQASTADRLTRQRGQDWTPIGGQRCVPLDNTDEGADALAELIGDQIDVDRRVDERLAARQRDREVSGAIQKFGENYPAIINNPLLTQAAMTAAADEITKDLMAAGLPKELLDPWRGNTDALAKLHGHAHASGHKVRSPDALLSATGQRMAREFNLPISGHNERRLAHKRAAGPQPRSAGARSGMSSTPRPQTAADIVAGMRRSRGFEPR